MSAMQVKSGVSIRLKEFDFQFVRSSGPGGQKVNKSSTCAVLSWKFAESQGLTRRQKLRVEKKGKRRINSEGVLQVRSDRFRDRGRNVADCIEKLRCFLIEALHVEKKRVPTKPTKAAKEKRIKDKKKHSEKKRLRGKPD